MFSILYESTELSDLPLSAAALANTKKYFWRTRRKETTLHYSMTYG